MNSRYEKLQEEKNAAYLERDKLLSLAARLSKKLGMNVGIGVDPKETDEEWKYVVFIDLPTGQVSWHVHSSELPFFDGIGTYTKKWDGHSTEEKYRRVMRYR